MFNNAGAGGCLVKIKIPPMVGEIITNALESVDGAIYTWLDRCPDCGGELRGHDYRRKKFATVLEGGRPRDIFVTVRRFRCTSCGRLCYARAPFYPNTRLGSPIVDFCILNIGRYPFNHISRLLEKMNIIVDRGTVRNYAALDHGPIPSVDMYGILIPYSLIRLSEPAPPAQKAGPVTGADLLVAGRFPTTHKASLHRRWPPEKRDGRDEEKKKE
jgi:hypothetical protein